MKKFILCIIVVIPFQLKSQNLFNEFLKYFSGDTLPYSIGEKSQRLVDKYVLKYICNGDSSCLEYEYMGINGDTREVVYIEKYEYEYNAYLKVDYNKTILLVYTGYVKCKDPEFTGRIMVGLFGKDGEKMDEMEFHVVNNEGVENLIDKRGTILEDKSSSNENDENIYNKYKSLKEKYSSMKSKNILLQKKIKSLTEEIADLKREKNEILEQKSLNVLNNFEKIDTSKITNISELSDLVINSINIFRES